MHEVKFDGYRAQLRVKKANAVIRTRTGLDWTERFGAVAKDAGAFPDCMIDGEIVALDDQAAAEFRRIAGGAVGGEDPTIWCSTRLICCSRAARICGPCR